MAATRSRETLLQALDRTYRGRRGREFVYRSLWGHLDPDETVCVAADGYYSYLNKHLMLLTDRRVLLARERIMPGRWKTLRDVPMTIVRGARSVSGSLTSASLEVTVAGQNPITMKIGNSDAAADFEQTLHLMSERRPATHDGPATPRPQRHAAGLVGDGEHVYRVFEGFSTWSSEQQQLLLTDRRVLLIGRQTPGNWIIRREVPAHEVTGTRVKGGTRLMKAAVEVDSRRHKPLVLRKGDTESAHEFVRTLKGLLREG